MSTTTQILFNSPALHSLKREQLIKLCKIHSLKANGKNVDLIQRLRQHAQALPKDTPLSVAARSECEVTSIQEKPIEMDDEDQQCSIQQDEHQYAMHAPRPSEQWEVVMDVIEEVEENSSQGTISSVRNAGSSEFGTGGSAASGSTVTSSIRALATSLGLRRTMAQLPLGSTSSKSSIPTVAIEEDVESSKPHFTQPETTLPQQTDHFMLETPRPSFGGAESHLPGHALRPGIPAPPNARLSLGLGFGVPTTPTRKSQPTTTIRLVSNPLSEQDSAKASAYEGENRTPRLKPFQTTFDISFGSPMRGDAFNFGFSGFNTWPPNSTDDVEMTTTNPNLLSTPSRPKGPTNAPPFVFGSPHHRVSNNQFRDAAASVLEEMNARLRAEGIDEIGGDIMNKLHPGKECPPVSQREINPIPTTKRGEITSKFDDAHDQEFSKMEGIDDTCRKREPKPKQPQSETNEKDPDLSNVVVSRKRKSSVLEQDSRPRRPSVKPRVSTTRVISNGRRSRTIPGAFDLDEDEEGPDESRAGKRIRVDSDTSTAQEESKRQDDEREIQLEKEKEAIRKKLEVNRARRRSSAAARKSIGKNGPRPSVLVKPKPKGSRFGFLSSAKTLVQSVWNRGKQPTSTPPSNIPKLTTSAVVQPELNGRKVEKGPRKAVPPPPQPFVPNRKAALAPVKQTMVNANVNKPMAISTRYDSLSAERAPDIQTHGSIRSTRSPRSRSPLPDVSTFNSNSSFSTTSGKVARAESILGTVNSRTSSGVSSVGTRFSGLYASSSKIGSMGTKSTLGGASRTSSEGTGSSSSSTTRKPARYSSRLLAPTASSLMKTVHQPTPSSTITSDAGRPKFAEKVALESITNSQFGNRTEATFSSQGKDGVLVNKRLVSPTKTIESDETGENAVLQKNSSLKRTLSGRKPRISRSKVIAKLASQRAASGSSISSSRSSGSGISMLKPRVSGSGRTRSSIGIKVSRSSYGTGGGPGGGGLKTRSSGGGNGFAAAVSAKRAARQSEYARRRSSRATHNLVVGDMNLF